MNLTFIEPEIKEINRKEAQNASYLRKQFLVPKGKKVRAAKLYATALGVYEPWINREKCTNRLLLPGFTNYHKRLQVQEFDVTNLLREGENVFLAVLGDGWYRGNLGAFNKKYCYGDKIKFACRLKISYEDGSVDVIETDASWEATQQGPLGINDLKIRECYDARREELLWDTHREKKNNGEMIWHECRESSYEGNLIPDEGEEVREQETFLAKVLHTPDGNTILDFGQNLAGHVEFSVKGPAGHTVTLVMGEALDEEGNFTLANIQGDNEAKIEGPMRLGQQLHYTLKEGRQTYKSKFLISGYRYAKVLNWPEEVKAENFTSIAVYSKMKETGMFSCSNERINRFVKCVKWSQKSNFVDIPTDCPQRERAGWAGDINVFLETANYLTDTRKFMRKWMEDFVGMQEADGGLPYIVPDVPAIGVGTSSAGWSDAISAVPLEMYRFYGEKRDLKQAYEAAKRFVDFNVKRAGKRNPLHLFRRGEHQKYILDTGFHYGEWLEPGDSNITGGLKAMVYPDDEVATAWFYYSASNVAKMAKILNREADNAYYEALAEKIRLAYRKQFLPAVFSGVKRQCKYVRPIYMGLADEAEAEKIAGMLNEQCVANDYRIGTGFLTTYQVLQVLTDYGYADTAYRMMEQENCPGWLYEVKSGATTCWEGWDAVMPESGKLKPLSQNHYAPGAAAAWLFSRCAGIRITAPGCARVEIRPIPGGTLTWAEASYESVRGRISVRWGLREAARRKKEKTIDMSEKPVEEFVLTVKIPEEISAVVVLPDHTKITDAKSGTYTCWL